MLVSVGVSTRRGPLYSLRFIPLSPGQIEVGRRQTSHQGLLSFRTFQKKGEVSSKIFCEKKTLPGPNYMPGIPDPASGGFIFRNSTNIKGQPTFLFKNDQTHI